jgi:hypothetical protein
VKYKIAENRILWTHFHLFGTAPSNGAILDEFSEKYQHQIQYQK